MSASWTSDWSDHEDQDLETPGSGATDGEGGDIMHVWTTVTMEERIEILAQVPTDDWDDESSFGVYFESGFINAPGNPWEVDDTAVLGIGIEGDAIDHQRRDVSGQIEVIDPDGTVVGGAVTDGGDYIVSMDPPEVAIQGTDGEFDTELDFTFVPIILDGLPFMEEDIDYPRATDVNIRYGAVVGTVSDPLGEPVEGTLVGRDGLYSETDEDGEYQILAPGGQVELTSLGGSLDKQVEVIEFETTTLNWQYPGFEITVLHPDGVPVPGVPVEFQNTTLHTGSDGKITVNTAPFGEINPVIMGSYDDIEFNLAFEGHFVSETFSGVASADINVEDDVTGEAVEHVEAIEQVVGILTTSGSEGKLGLLAPEAGEYTFIIAPEDRRYASTTLKVVLEEDEVAEIETKMKRRTATTRR